MNHLNSYCLCCSNIGWLSYSGNLKDKKKKKRRRRRRSLHLGRKCSFKKKYSDKILCSKINYHYTANNLTPWENLKRHQIHIFLQLNSFFPPVIFFFLLPYSRYHRTYSYSLWWESVLKLLSVIFTWCREKGKKNLKIRERNRTRQDRRPDGLPKRKLEEVRLDWKTSRFN